MSNERWRRVDEIFTEAMDQPAAMRADLVRRRCGADADLHDEIAALLSASARSGDFLASPALDVFARQISREGWHVRTGDRVGVYTIGQRLGAGGMGEVWRARDDRLGRDVAIKLLLPHPSDAAGRVAGFRREARAAGALNHTNILTVYDVGDHDGAPYLVMECLEGESLRTRLARGPLTVDAALDIVLQTARGLGDGACAGHRASRSQAREHLSRSRRAGEDPRLRPGELARRAIASFASVDGAGWFGRDDTADSRPAHPATWRPSRCGARSWTDARTSSRWARCCTKCSPAAGCSGGTARSGHSMRC